MKITFASILLTLTLINNLHAAEVTAPAVKETAKQLRKSTTITIPHINTDVLLAKCEQVKPALKWLGNKSWDGTITTAQFVWDNPIKCAMGIGSCYCVYKYGATLKNWGKKVWSLRPASAGALHAVQNFLQARIQNGNAQLQQQLASTEKNINKNINQKVSGLKLETGIINTNLVKGFEALLVGQNAMREDLNKIQQDANTKHSASMVMLGKLEKSNETTHKKLEQLIKNNKQNTWLFNLFQQAITNRPELVPQIIEAAGITHQSEQNIKNPVPVRAGQIPLLHLSEASPSNSSQSTPVISPRLSSQNGSAHNSPQPSHCWQNIPQQNIRSPLPRTSPRLTPKHNNVQV